MRREIRANRLAEVIERPVRADQLEVTSSFGEQEEPVVCRGRSFNYNGSAVARPHYHDFPWLDSQLRNSPPGHEHEWIHQPLLARRHPEGILFAQPRKRGPMKAASLFLLALLTACSSSTESSSPPFDLASATGGYTVTLTIASQGSFGPSCTPLTLMVGAPRSWTGTCINSITSAGTVTQVGDTLVLAVSGAGPIGASPRPIKLYEFGGTEANMNAKWDGALCWDNAAIGGCVREHGTAAGHR